MYDFLPPPHPPSHTQHSLSSKTQGNVESKTIVDSGTKSDVVPDKSNLDSGTSYSCATRVVVVGGGELNSKTRGSVTLPGTSPDGKTDLTLDDVLVIPGNSCFLLSMSKMDKRGYLIVVENGVMNFFKRGSNTPTATALLNANDGLYHVLTKRTSTHQRFGL